MKLGNFAVGHVDIPLVVTSVLSLCIYNEVNILNRGNRRLTIVSIELDLLALSTDSSSGCVLPPVL